MESIQPMKASLPKAEGQDDDDDDSRVEYSVHDSEPDEHASSDIRKGYTMLTPIAEGDRTIDWKFDVIDLCRVCR
jgi:hypothetical protein